jgi:copper(I)-binding protein
MVADMQSRMLCLAAAGLLLTCGVPAYATPAAPLVTVSNAWALATVPAQTASGAYMELNSKEGARLVKVESPVAGSIEMHEMKMDGNVMKMRELKNIDIPPGKTIRLDSSGYHLMLLDLKHQLKPGTVAPLTLTVESRDGRRSKIEVNAEVRPPGAAR